MIKTHWQYSHYSNCRTRLGPAKTGANGFCYKEYPNPSCDILAEGRN